MYFLVKRDVITMRNVAVVFKTLEVSVDCNSDESTDVYPRGRAFLFGLGYTATIRERSNNSTTPIAASYSTQQLCRVT